MTDRNDAAAIIAALKADGLITQSQINRLNVAATRINKHANVQLFEIADIVDEAIRSGQSAENAVVNWESASTNSSFYWTARAIRGGAQ